MQYIFYIVVCMYTCIYVSFKFSNIFFFKKEMEKHKQIPLINHDKNIRRCIQSNNKDFKMFQVPIFVSASDLLFYFFISFVRLYCILLLNEFPIFLYDTRYTSSTCRFQKFFKKKHTYVRINHKRKYQKRNLINLNN